MTETDVCIVSTRRPGLLRQTLASLSVEIFRHLEIANAYLNLDPIFGDEEDHKACVSLFRQHFPQGTIFEPETPGFAPAVQRLWLATRSQYVLHLEDDWVALSSIGQDAYRPFEDPSVTQVSFHTAEKNWDVRKSGHLHFRREYVKLLGIKFPTLKKKPIFTTSPSILRGSFARNCADLLDLSRDPEKQFYSGVNSALEAYVAPYRNHILSPGNKPIIKDIGRSWRTDRGIEKVVKDSISTWE